EDTYIKSNVLNSYHQPRVQHFHQTISEAMEEQRQKAETFLKSLSDLSQKICRLWPHGVVSVSAELRKHLVELYDVTNLFNGLPYSVKEEYKRKAGEVLINSGLIALLCEKATPWLENKLYDVTDVIWALHVCTLGSKILLKKDGDLHRLLTLMVNLLKESFFDHMAGTLQQGGDAVLELSLAVLNGLAEVEENKQHIHLPSILSVLKAYSMSENERVYNYAIITMALLETERRADIFSPNHDTVQFLLGQLKALEREGFNPHRKLAGVFGAICVLTQNPGNRELLVQGGVLPYLEKGLAKCVSENNREETATCSNITISLHYLTLAERNKAEIMKHKQLLDSLASIHFDQCHSHHPDCIVVAKCALSNLGMNPQDLSNDGPRRTGEEYVSTSVFILEFFLI
ncbi:uncharacterized protein, partial [Littorina saxatilis]|uniref:uncharacterized protein n=1 Tax=Littorina saxatilis TaxID=31220 RepID=UPI0038B4D167